MDDDNKHGPRLDARLTDLTVLLAACALLALGAAQINSVGGVRSAGADHALSEHDGTAIR